MSAGSDLVLWLAAWLATMAAVIAFRARRPATGAGLVTAYLVNLWLLHWLAASLYLIDSHRFYDESVVVAGFRLSTLGLLAFAVGSVALSPTFMKGSHRSRGSSVSFSVHPALPKAYLLIGVAFYVSASTVLSDLPTVGAVVGVGQNLFLIGIALYLWRAWEKRDFSSLAGWFVLTLMLPFVTIVARGFIGYGAAAAIFVLAFLASFFRPKGVVLVSAVVIGFLGLSLFVGYARDRNEIRAVVWGGRPVPERIEQVYASVRDFELFDASNEDHLLRVDQRLNQNYLVGEAVRGLSVSKNYAGGATVWDSLVSLVPRAVWPNKPSVAGSGDLVTRYTGISFAEGTAVGVGHVLELYINFGTPGVLMGFLLLGLLLGAIDSRAAKRLSVGDWQGFALWALVGVSFLQVGGSLFELTTSAGASVLLAVFLNRFLLHRLQRRRGMLGVGGRTEGWAGDPLHAGGEPGRP